MCKLNNLWRVFFQLLESHLANLYSKHMIKSLTPAEWKDDIGHLMGFVHLLPASALEVYEKETLSFAILSKIDSSSLSFRQVRF